MVAELKVSETGRYSVTQTAKVLGINTSTVWRWTNEGILKPINVMASRKKYSGSAIKRAWLMM